LNDGLTTLAGIIDVLINDGLVIFSCINIVLMNDGLLSLFAPLDLSMKYGLTTFICALKFING
jgi:hypothetical protein